MRRSIAWFLAFAFTVAGPAFGQKLKVVSGLKNPESAAVGLGGRVFFTLLGDRGKSGDGSLGVVEPSGRVATFATGLDDPHGLVAVGGAIYVADVKKVWRVDARGKAEVFVGPGAFPRAPGFLEDIAIDGLGNIYVSDSGDRAGKGGAIFRIDARKRVVMALDGDLASPVVPYPRGLIVDDVDHLIVADYGFGHVYRFDMNTSNAQRIAGGFGGATGLVKDSGGGLIVGDAKNGRIFQVPTDLEPPILLSEKIRSPAGLTITPDGRTLIVPDTKAGTLTWLPIR